MLNSLNTRILPKVLFSTFANCFKATTLWQTFCLWSAASQLNLKYILQKLFKTEQKINQLVFCRLKRFLIWSLSYLLVVAKLFSVCNMVNILGRQCCLFSIFYIFEKFGKQFGAYFWELMISKKIANIH